MSECEVSWDVTQRQIKKGLPQKYDNIKNYNLEVSCKGIDVKKNVFGELF